MVWYEGFPKHKNFALEFHKKQDEFTVYLVKLNGNMLVVRELQHHSIIEKRTRETSEIERSSHDLYEF